MKLKLVVPFCLLFSIGSCLRSQGDDRQGGPGPEARAVPTTETAAIEVLFSPKGGCTERIVKLIDGAKKSVHIQAYSFTSKPIADAVDRASHRPGVQVYVILDRSDFNTPVANRLIESSIPVWFDRKHPIAHNKLIIRDQEEVEEGSFNFTKQAEANAENCNFIHSKNLAKQYLANWELHRSHSDPPTSSD